MSELSTMEIDIDRVRRDTPGCRDVIHLNNAGASLPPDPVTNVLIEHLRLESRIGGYEAADRAADRLAGMYRSAARLLGCSPDEIAYSESATRAWDLAFYSLPLREGDIVITAPSEYVSNMLAMLQLQERLGLQVEVAPEVAWGELDLAWMEQRLASGDERIKAVCLSHVPTQSGMVAPVAEVGALTRRAGVPFIVDACQSVGQLQIDVDAIGCDVLTTTGRKYLRGPRGTGLLYVRRGLIDDLVPPFVDVGSAVWTSPTTYEFVNGARRFEQWESYVAGRLGLRAALDYALDLGMAAVEARVRELATALRDELSQVPGVTLRDPGPVTCGIVTFTVAGRDSERVCEQLRAGGVNTSVSTTRSAQLDFPRRGVTEVVRASVHYYNTHDEIARTGELLRRLGDV